jgi:molybdopterin/thiamine biosynthesis adenylyltransferase
MDKLKAYPITVCGAGALGANILENLARSGLANLKVIDCDRIEERNLSTQPYYRADVGSLKAKILSSSLYRALGVKLQAETEKLTEKNVAKLLGESRLVIDTFDNSVARGIVKDYCEQTNLPCLHAGLASDYAEVIWNEVYRVPSEVNDDVCDYPLARNLVLLTVAVTCETLINFLVSQEQVNYTLTLKDLQIQPYSPS